MLAVAHCCSKSGEQTTEQVTEHNMAWHFTDWKAERLYLKKTAVVIAAYHL